MILLFNFLSHTHAMNNIFTNKIQRNARTGKERRMDTHASVWLLCSTLSSPLSFSLGSAQAATGTRQELYWSDQVVQIASQCVIICNFLWEMERKNHNQRNQSKINLLSTTAIITQYSSISFNSPFAWVGSAVCVLDSGAPNGNFRENICSEDDLRSKIFGTFVEKFLACLPLLGFSNI